MGVIYGSSGGAILTMDGEVIGETVDVEMNYESRITNERVSKFNISEGVSIEMKNVETNLRTLSDKTRMWCKRMTWDGKIYW